jgi:hypothetical protein
MTTDTTNLDPHASSHLASCARVAAALCMALGVMVGLSVTTPPAAQAQDQTFDVESISDAGDNNPGDGTCATSGGVCTLRAAIEEANSDATRDKVVFSSIPTSGGFATITLNNGTLEVTEELNIDGTTAPNYPSSVANGPIVKIDASGSTDAIRISGADADGSRVAGLAIVSSSDDGVEADADNVRIKDCFVGLDVDGTTVQANSFGIYVQSGNSDVTVVNNVVSGNDSEGLLINGSSHTIIDNIIGLDYDGDAAKGNGDQGIDVLGDDHLIGNAFLSFDPTTGVELVDNGNTVSANADDGIEVVGDNNAVRANNVGTSSDGSTATGTGGNSLGNGNNGVVVKGTGSDPSQNNVIGVTNLNAEANLVSGNDKDGIALGNDAQGEVSSQDTVRGNVIGLNGARDTPLPNGASTSLDGGIVGSRVEGAIIDSNMVSGNDGQGIIIFSGSGNNGDIFIFDNIVGTNRSFATGLGNEYDGIQVKPNPSSGTESVDVVENIIGNNENDGIDIRGSYHNVTKNYVGAAPDGSDIGNGVNNQGRGIIIGNGSSSLTFVNIGLLDFIGFPDNDQAAGFDTPTGNGNVIGNNRADGILVRGEASNIEIAENYVGTNPSGADLGNGSGADDGIRIVESGNSVSNVVVGYDEGDSFSSPDPADGGDGNVVAYNSGDGISAGSDESATNVTDVTVRGNRVFQNGAANNTNIGIDLGNSGQTSNDVGDGDDGPNNLQNFPVIQSVSCGSSGCTASIDYEVETNTGNAAYPLTVDFYAADSEQSGEGKIYLKTQEYSSSQANNTASVGIDLSNFSNVDRNDYFVATVTDASGNTSEFFGPPGEQLPVELASFEARQAGEDAARLTWTTASETGNAGFRVQRRKAPEDGSPGSWQKVGFVDSKAEGGSSTEALTYRFTAEDLGVGTHEFRLKQKDLDGSAHAHDPVTVELQMQEALRLGAPAPNPVSGRATLSFAVQEQAEATLALYNTLGQRVATLYRGTPQAGEQETTQVDATGLSSGTYFLRLRANGQTQTQSLTIVR